MAKLPEKTNVADVGAQMGEYFIVKKYTSDEVGNNSHFAYFSENDILQIQGAAFINDFKDQGDFSAGSVKPNSDYVLFINAEKPVRIVDGKVGTPLGGHFSVITWSVGANDTETENNWHEAIKPVATQFGVTNSQVHNMTLQAAGLQAKTYDITPQDDDLSVSYLTFQQGGSVHQFHGDSTNIIQALNNFYGVGKSEVIENKKVNFKSLKNQQNALRGVVMQTIGDIFTDGGLWPYYKANAPWGTTNAEGIYNGGALSGTLFNYRAISGLSGQLTGLEYLVTGGESTSNYSGFVNLVDTPTGFSGGMLLKVTQDATGIEFVNPTGFLTSQDIVWKVYPETSDLPSATDYHGMFAHVHGGGGAAYMAHGGAWHKIWPNDTEAGSTSFTGLSGTPGNFVANKFLKVTSDGTGIEYSDIDFPDSEVTFTGLSGTPGFFTANKFLKVTSDGTGIEYADIDFPDSEVTFTGLSGTPGSFTANKFLKVTSDGTGIEYADVPLDGSGASFFTGLIDTPSILGSAGQIVKVNAGGTALEFTDIIQGATGFLELDDTPIEYQQNAILMSTETGLAYTSLPGGTFTGLGDTPTGINNFDFLIGDDAGHVIATGDVSKLISFTGLKDTPSSWSSNQYLVINSEGNAVTYSGFNNTFTGLVDTPNPSQLNKGDFLVIDGANKVTTRASGQLSNLISFTGLNDTPNTITNAFYVVGTTNGLGFTNVKPTDGGTAPTFVGLPDTPANFVGEQGKLLRINSSQSAVEFFELTSSTINSLATLTGLSDTPTGITGNYLLVGSGSQFIYQPYINSFTGLNDTPSIYGSTGYALRISSDNKIEFYKPTFSGLFDTSEVSFGQYLSVDGTGGIYGRDITLTGLSDVDSEGFGPNKFLQVTGTAPDYKFVYTGIHFTGLEGVPTDWSDTNTGKFLALNSAGDSIVFVNAPDGGGGGAASFLGLADVDPSSFSSESGKVLVVNSDENAITFTGLNETFTGLLDTPTDYPDHLGVTGIHYLTTASAPNRTIWDNSLSVVIYNQGSAITDLDSATGHLHERLYLTGLRDTPSNIENSKYLGTNGVGQIVWLDASAGGSAPSFSGLSDSPAGFHYSGVSGQFVVASGDGVVFSTPGINDLSGLALTNDTTEYLTFDGTFITGKTLSFSNLVETPTGISGGKFLKGTADGTGLEFVDIEFPESTSISGFTGLHDTPSSYDPEKFLRAHPDGTGIEYATPTFTGLADTPNSLQANAFLKVNSAGNGFVFSTGLSGSGYAQVITGATHFTGLQDTPSTITNNRVLFTKNGNINFIEPTGLALKLTDLTDTPKAITDGKILVGNAAGNLELQDPAANYKVISVDETDNSNSIILNSYNTGVHLKTLSAGNRIELDPVHAFNMDDIRFSVTNKSFQLEIEAAKPATTASAKEVLQRIQYNSQRSNFFKGSTRYANLDKVLDGVPQTSYKFAKEGDDKFTRIRFQFKYPIYIHSFYYDGDTLPSAWYSKTPLGNTAGAQAGTITAFRTPRSETSQFSADGRSWKSLGKISAFDLFGVYWWPRIREIKIAYTLEDIDADKKYRLIDREFADPALSINPKIYVHRGEEYDFLIQSKDEPFYIKTQPGVGTSNQYSHGVTNAGTTGQMPVVFDVPLDAPDRLYYQGANNSNLSGIIEIPPLDLTQQITDQITGEGVSTFLGLSDTPSSFENEKYLRVTADGTGIEYADIDIEPGSASFTGLSGTPGFFTANKFLKVTSDGTGIEYADVPLDGSGASFFTGLIDSPNSLGSAGQIVRVNAGGTALEFADASAGGGGGGGGGAGNGGVGSHTGISELSNFYQKLPDRIQVPLTRGTSAKPQERLFNFEGFFKSSVENDRIAYEWNIGGSERFGLTFKNDSNGTFDSYVESNDSASTSINYNKIASEISNKPTLGEFISGGRAVYLGYGESGAIAGNTHWKNNNNFHTDLPDALALNFTANYTGIYHLNQIFDDTVYYESRYHTSQLRYIQFKNTPVGELDGANHAGFGAGLTPSSLSGCVASGFALYYGGGAPGLNGAGGGGGGAADGSGVSNFTGLLDTPNDLGSAGQFLKVNASRTALEFTDAPAGGGGGGFSLPGPTSATYAGGIELISDTGNNIFKRIAQGDNISFQSTVDGLTINADFPPATTTFKGLSDTPSSFVADKVIKVNALGNALEYTDINLKQPVGSGFAKHKPILDQDSFEGDIPDHIYLQNSAGTNIQTFSFAQYSQGSHIEYAPSRTTDFGSYIQFNDNAEGSYKTSDITQEVQNRMSISGFVASGRHHHEAARNTGVHNQGFRSILSAGGAELTEDLDIEPPLQNVIGTNRNWTQLRFPFDGARQCSWTVPPSLTQNFLDGTVQVEIAWNSPSTAGDVVWKVKMESYAVGESIDSDKGTSFKTITSSAPSTAYGMKYERIQFVPSADELSSDGFLIITVKREALDGADTLNGFANLLYLSAIELI